MTDRLTPSYKVTLGEAVIDSAEKPRASTVIALNVELDIDAPADACTMILGGLPDATPALGDDVKVELGYLDGETELVLTGTVTDARRTLTTTRVVAHGHASALLRAFVDETYESKKSGAIVRDLADRAGVEVATAQDGNEYAAYVVDGRRNVHTHMRDLAALSGFDVYLNSEGKLVFEKYVGGRIVHVYEHAKQVIEARVAEREPAVASVEAWGESSGKQGGQRWAWLTKDFGPSTGKAGSGSPKLLLERPALRASQAAKTSAETLLTATRRRAIGGHVEGPGRPEVKLGDGVRLKTMPAAALDGTFQVRRVVHRVDRRRGFVTVTHFRSSD
jgi:phage protein D